MDEFSALCVGCNIACVAVGPAISDAKHKVGSQERRIAIAVRCLQAAHSGRQLVIVGDCSPTHQDRRNDRHASDLGELNQEVGIRISIDDTTTCNDQRTFRLVEHCECFFNLGAEPRLVGIQRLICVGINSISASCTSSGKSISTGPGRPERMM